MWSPSNIYIANYIKISHINFEFVKPFVKDQMTNLTDLKMPAISQIKTLNVLSKDLSEYTI